MGKVNQEIHFVNVSLDVSNLQYGETKIEYCPKVKYSRGGVATYKEIKAYIFERHGLKVSSLYIGQVKDKIGIKERINYHVGSGKGKVPICPIEKENAIVEAFKFFGMM